MTFKTERESGMLEQQEGMEVLSGREGKKPPRTYAETLARGKKDTELGF